MDDYPLGHLQLMVFTITPALDSSREVFALVDIAEVSHAQNNYLKGKAPWGTLNTEYKRQIG